MDYESNILAVIEAQVKILISAVKGLFRAQEDTTINATKLEVRVTDLEERKHQNDETSQQGE